MRRETSYKRVKGRSHAAGIRISMHPHKPHAASQPSRFSHTPRLSTDSAGKSAEKSSGLRGRRGEGSRERDVYFRGYHFVDMLHGCLLIVRCGELQKSEREYVVVLPPDCHKVLSSCMHV